MWKRLNRKGNQSTGVDSTIYEEEYVDWGFKNPGGLMDSNDARRQPPVRPPRDSNTGLPPLPFEPVQNQSAQPQNSYMRPASSIYSNTSPNMPDGKFPRNSVPASSVWEDEDVDISPPSSPDVRLPVRQTRRQAHEPVSPIMSPVEEIPDVSRMQVAHPGSQTKPRPGSNIPVLRRERRRNQVAQAAANLLSKNQNKYGDGIRDKSSAEPLHDSMTGKLTTTNIGRQPVKPGEFTPPKALLNKKTTEIAAPTGQSSFGDRVRKLKNVDMMSGSRPEWNGSSGRIQPVPAVEDELEIPPLRIPRKSSLRSNSPRISESGNTTPHAPAFRAGKAETSRVSPSALGYPGFMMRRRVSDRTGENHEGSQDYATYSTSYTPQTSEAITQQKPNKPNSSKALPTSRDESTSKIERDFREAFKDISLPGGASYEQPPSRFSVTTYATTTASSTPRISEDSIPPMPTPPKQSANSVLNRVRPKIGKSLDSTNQIARKAIGEPVFVSMSSVSRRNSKMLPKSPLEAQSTDLITSLEAQLENLKQRRINLQRSIHQMTELMPTDPMARGMEAKRQADEKRKVELLREDLADVQREEHELGLRLHRAWKRRDQDAIYEPTGLWVRRVTG